MKKLLIAFTLGLLLFSSFGVSADYSDELDDTEYTWVLTAWDFEGADDVAVDDEFTFVFNEAPAGNTVSDFEEGDVDLLYNGNSYDISENFTDFNDKDAVFFVLAFLWAVEDPSDTFNDDPDISIDGDDAILEDDDSRTVWDASSGLLKLYEFDDGDDEVTLELQEGFFSFLPINPLFFVFTLFAIPLVRKLRN